MLRVIEIDINSPVVGRRTLLDQGALMALLSAEKMIKIIDMNKVKAIVGNGLDTHVCEFEEWLKPGEIIVFHRRCYFRGKTSFSLREALEWFGVEVIN